MEKHFYVHFIDYFDKLCSFSSCHRVSLFYHQRETCEHGEKLLNWTYLLWRCNGECQVLLRQHFKNDTTWLRFSVSAQFLSLCTDNSIAPWFLQYKLQPIHTNLLNSAGLGRGKWTTTVRLPATEQQRLEDFIPFRLFKLSTLHLFLNLLYTPEEAFHLMPDIWISFHPRTSVSWESTGGAST